MAETAQLARLKRRLSLTETSDKDALLADLISDAQSLIRAYTGRHTLPALLDGAIVELAAGTYNRLGLEGEGSHSEGGVSASFDALPAHLRAALHRQRLGKVGG